jgi:hypothetical protein
MAQMIRKQIYIDADSERYLKKRSRELGVTEAEVVRQALVAQAERDGSDERLQALEEILADIRENHMGNVSQAPQTPWKFNREEVYEERMQELDRRREAARARVTE